MLHQRNDQKGCVTFQSQKKINKNANTMNNVPLPRLCQQWFQRRCPRSGLPSARLLSQSQVSVLCHSLGGVLFRPGRRIIPPPTIPRDHQDSITAPNIPAVITTTSSFALWQLLSFSLPHLNVLPRNIIGFKKGRKNVHGQVRR